VAKRYKDMNTEAASVGVDFTRVIQTHQAGVWRYLKAIGCDSSRADDLTQETFLAVLQKPFQDYDRSATAAYLRKVARSLFVSQQRRASRVVVLEELDEVDEAWRRWADKDGGQGLVDALRSCLETLREKARTALELRFRQRCSRADIAAAVGMSQDGAKNLMQRAKQHLRQCIERRMT